MPVFMRSPGTVSGPSDDDLTKGTVAQGNPGLLRDRHGLAALVVMLVISSWS